MNPNLLKITSIPISIEVNVTNGTLKAPEDKEPLKIDINRTPGGYKHILFPLWDVLLL